MQRIARTKVTINFEMSNKKVTFSNFFLIFFQIKKIMKMLLYLFTMLYKIEIPDILYSL